MWHTTATVHRTTAQGEVERLRRELAAAVQRADATEAERRQLATTLTQRDVAGEGERRELRAALIQAREAEEAAVVRVRAAEARGAQLDHDLTAARCGYMCARVCSAAAQKHAVLGGDLPSSAHMALSAIHRLQHCAERVYILQP